MKTLVHFRTGVVLFAILATPCCLAAAANPPAKPSATTHQYVDPFPTVMETTVHYQSRRWLSNSLARINLGTVLAQRKKPWLLVQLPMQLNQFYHRGKNEILPAKVEYVLTRSPRLPLKTVIWTGPRVWGLHESGNVFQSANSGRREAREISRHALRGEYLRSFQGLVIFRVNDKVKGMHRIDPIWQVSEKWKSMVKPAWLFCKAHKTWFLGQGPAKHVADLKKLLPDKNLLVAANAFRLLSRSDSFRREMFAGKLFSYHGVRLGAYAELLIAHASHADLAHSRLLAARIVKIAMTKSQQNWLLAGAYQAANYSPRPGPFNFGFSRLPDAMKAAKGSSPIKGK